MKLKKVSSKQKGLAKLPTAVRNKMGYMNTGGRVGDPKKEDPKKGSTSPSISFDMSATSKKEQKSIDRAAERQEREDKKGMVPAKYRNRGQAGLDAYKADMAKKRSRKNAKGLAKILGTKAARKTAAATRKASRSAKRRMAAGRGAGCQGKGCGAYE